MYFKLNNIYDKDAFKRFYRWIFVLISAENL